ncbi:MAG: hypothetical protein IJO73_04745 [Clostridia bacterium]|nr:hypothetical protein [Clostridia bacterium]
MKKTKRKTEFTFRNIRSPYRIEGSDDSINDYYQRYLQDEEAIIEIDGLTYYKIIELCEFRIREARALVLLDYSMNLKTGDLLVDEKGNEFNVMSFEMIKFCSDTFPEWYLKINQVVIDGDPYSMGEYLAKV